VVLLKDGAAAFLVTTYGKASGGFDPDSLTKDFRSRVRASQSIQSEFLTMKYANGQRIPGFAAGRQIEIPGAGQYEMYFIFSLVNQQASINVVNRSIFIAFIVLLLMIALITSLLIRQVVRPIRRAALIADEFAEGKFKDRMEVLNQDEIARLGTAFNTMADAIQAQITRLENLSRVQQRFVSDVTHELRTPLTTLRMASEVLYGTRGSFEPSVARSSELLVAQIDRFELLLEDLLEVSRFDAEVAVLEGVEFDLAALLARSIEDLALVAKEHQTQFVLKSNSQPILIKADIRRVERILRNLMSNAIDHAEGKPIEISIIASESEVAVGVRDFGVGIDKGALSRVFDRFWRADPSRARTRGGTGLGLSIALEDARLHNGELDAWGRPGLGAHFVLTLPRNYENQIERRLIAIEPKDIPRTEIG
jgi:two-component system sensor histidine kinase MtrB